MTATPAAPSRAPATPLVGARGVAAVPASAPYPLG